MKHPRKLIIAGVLLFLLLVMGLGLFRSRPVSFRVPDQNGYQSFLQAIASAPDAAVPAFTNQEGLVTFVSNNIAAYGLVQSGLQMTCVVPVKASKEWYAQHMGQEVPGLRRLAQGLIAKAKLAELEGKIEEAFEGYTEAYRFSDAIGRGGLAVDFIISMWCKARVLRDCQALIPLLTPTQKSAFLALIQKLEAEKDAANAVAERTRRWQRATFGLKGKVDEWQEALHEVWQSRSWVPLTPGRITLARKMAYYQQTYVEPLRQRLAAAGDLKETRTEPDGAANAAPPHR